ncbi:hypothetical protein BDR26DRAFT_915971 [Obelidium mucronatum]|nr:hypothetical protein BDR26DRAFT_915971 [Obelidium mucronatum]
MPVKPHLATTPPLSTEQQLKALDSALAAVAKKKKARANVTQLTSHERRLLAAKAALVDASAGGRPQTLTQRLARVGFNVGARRHSELAAHEPAPCFEQAARLGLENVTCGDLARDVRRDPLFGAVAADAEADAADDLPLLATNGAAAGDDAELQNELDAELARFVLCAASRFYWSFCLRKLVEAKDYWHCSVCVECQPIATTRHCDSCATCFTLDEDVLLDLDHHASSASLSLSGIQPSLMWCGRVWRGGVVKHWQSQNKSGICGNPCARVKQSSQTISEIWVPLIFLASS